MILRLALLLAFTSLPTTLVFAFSKAEAQTADRKIYATASPYSLVWNGNNGVFRQESLGGKPAEELPLTYLYTSSGPEGFARHLVWFLARKGDGFRLLWCYLNDSGRDFWCYLYSYPDNTLTTHEFKGEYRYSATASDPPQPLDLLLKPAPPYNGPDFAYKNWTRKTGDFQKLSLFEPSLGTKGAASKTLDTLKVTPLHEVSVGGKNGWRSDGWRELHSLAYGSDTRPYYLIQYSNTPDGYVIDLTSAKLYTANFEAPVKFDADPIAIGTPADNAALPALPRARRYEIFEIALTSKTPLSSPFTDAVFRADVKSPDGRVFSVPGYWDGERNFRVRLAPNRIGLWSYVTHSDFQELDGKSGTFECLPDESSIRGYFGVNPSVLYGRHFAVSDGTPFYPVSVNTPLLTLTPQEREAQRQENTLREKPALPASFVLFRKRMEALARQGVNRITGSFVWDQEVPANEGGSLWPGDSPTRINPDYFAWLDRRLEVCRTLGLVPDFGIARKPGMLAGLPAASLEAVWLTFLARYEAHNIAFTLFASDEQSIPENTRARIAALAKLTQKYNALEHPVSTISSVLPAPPPEPVVGRYVVRKRPPGEFREGKKSAPGTVFAQEAWLDTITQPPGSLEVVARNLPFEKPILVQNTPLLAERERVREMWRITMQGAYWLDQTPVTAADPALPSWRTAHDRLLSESRFWRLDPHSDLLTTEKRPVSPAAAPLPLRLPADTPSVLADPAWEYLVYFENGGKATLDLLEATGKVRVQWMNTLTGAKTEAIKLDGGGRLTFETPDKGDWVLLISRR